MSSELQQLVTHAITLIPVTMLLVWLYRTIRPAADQSPTTCKGCLGSCSIHGEQSDQTVKLTINQKPPRD